MIGERMRQARLMQGLSLQEVADRLGAAGAPLTRAGLSKYERSGSTPSASLLLRLAKVLGVRAEYFLEEPRATVQWIAFRSRSNMPEKARDRVRAMAENAVECTFGFRRRCTPTRKRLSPHQRTFRGPQMRRGSLRGSGRSGVSGAPLWKAWQRPSKTKAASSACFPRKMATSMDYVAGRTAVTRSLL